MARASLPSRPDLLPGADLPPPPRQQRSSDRRTPLEAAALRLFGKHGYGATSVDGVAAEAGVAVGGFYLHFRSKRQLLLSLMNDLLIGLSRVDLEMKTDAGPRRIIHALLLRGLE